MNMDELRVHLVRQRGLKGLTQREAAKNAGMTQAHFCDLETGKIANPGVNTINRWATGIKVKLSFVTVDIEPVALNRRVQYDDVATLAQEFIDHFLAGDTEYLFNVATDLLQDAEELQRYINTVRAAVAELNLAPSGMDDLMGSLAQVHNGEVGAVLYDPADDRGEVRISDDPIQTDPK